MGDRLGVDLYYAAVFAFGVRIFQNLASIRHHALTHYYRKKKKINGVLSMNKTYWQIPITIVLLFLGIMLSLQFQAQTRIASDLTYQRSEP